MSVDFNTLIFCELSKTLVMTIVKEILIGSSKGVSKI